MEILVIFGFCLIYLLILANNDNNKNSNKTSILPKNIYTYIYEIYTENEPSRAYFDSKYPLTPVKVHENTREREYRLLAVADLDTSSKSDKKYLSYLLSGKLIIGEDDLNNAKIDFESEPHEINSEYSFGERGMELSELIVFNGKLYSCDDRTGIIYEIVNGDEGKFEAMPWVILLDGDGKNTSKGFKCEWMAVKDEKLYVGGLGKEWTTHKGVFVNYNPQWVKVVGHLGDIVHVNWAPNYNMIRAKGGYNYPGYMIFESVAWSSMRQRWVFLPRRASKESYDGDLDEQRATNLVITADEDFSTIDYHTIGDIVPIRGYSSFKFVPNTNDRLIIALKSEEDEGQTRTYVTLFEIFGKILVKDKLISSRLKYEGIEFI